MNQNITTIEARGMTAPYLKPEVLLYDDEGELIELSLFTTPKRAMKYALDVAYEHDVESFTVTTGLFPTA